MAYDPRDPNIFYFVGEGNITANSVTGQAYKYIALGIIVNVATGIIMDAHVTLVSPLANEFVRAQFVGRSMETETNDIIEDIKRYHGSAQKAIVVAFKSVIDKYRKNKLA